MAILDLPETCATDLLGARCHAVPFEKAMGYPGTHTNCQDILAECIGEYGLTPDDVHDSLNFWMNSGWDLEGNYIPNFERSTGKAGDSVTLLAVMDVLAVPNTCGGGDFSSTSNYWFNPIKIEVRSASKETKALSEQLLREHTGFKTQRRPEQFKVKEIKADREIRPTPNYSPEFEHCPIHIHELSIPCTVNEVSAIEALIQSGKAIDSEDAIRFGVMSRFDVTAQARRYDQGRRTK